MKGKIECAIFFARTFSRSRCAKGICSADSERTQSSIPKSEASVLIVLTPKSANHLIRLRRGLGSSSAAVHNVSFVFFFLSVLGLNTLKQWLVLLPCQ